MLIRHFPLLRPLLRSGTPGWGLIVKICWPKWIGRVARSFALSKDGTYTIAIMYRFHQWKWQTDLLKNMRLLLLSFCTTFFQQTCPQTCLSPTRDSSAE